MTKAQLSNMRHMCRHAGIGFWATGQSDAARQQRARLTAFVRALGVRVEGNKAVCSDGIYTL